MAENFMVCNCKQVSYNSIVDAIHSVKHFDDLTAAFGDVQKMTLARIITPPMVGVPAFFKCDCTPSSRSV